MAAYDSRAASWWNLERVVLLVIAPLVLLTSIWSAIPGNPFEADAGPLDALVPADVDVALRGEGIAIAEHGFVQALGLTPDDVRGVLEEAAAQLPPEHHAERIARDFLSREFVLALRDDEPLLLLRCSGKVRELDLAYEMDQERLDEYHATVLGDFIRVDREDDVSLFVARHRDVLLVSTDEELLRAAFGLGDAGEGSLARRSDYRNGLGTDESPAGRLTAWADQEFVDDLLHGVGSEGPVAWLPELLTIDELGPCAATAELLPGRVRFALRAQWPNAAGEVAPALLPRATPAVTEPVRSTIQVDGEPVVLDSVLRVRARTLLIRMLAALPVGEADSGTLDATAARLAAYVADEARLVVTRLPEADELDVESRAEGAPRSLPGVLLELRLRPGASRQELAADLDETWRAVAGEQAAVVADDRVLRLVGAGWGERWRLLSPAAALTETSLILASNDALLRRVRRSTAAPDARDGPTEAMLADVRIDFGPLQQHLVDQRGSDARELLHQDLTGLRGPMTRRVRVKHRGSPLTGDALQQAVDAEIDAYRRRIRDVDFPAALEHGRRRWDLLETFDTVELHLLIEGRELQIDADLRVR